MNLARLFLIPAVAAGLVIPSGLPAAEPDPGQICISVGRLLEQGHYSRRRLDDKVSQQLLTTYLEALDYNHLFFTREDVDKFTSEHATTLDDDIMLGNPEAAFEIYDVYTKRVEDRVAKVKALITGEFKFDSKRTVELNRQKAPWPENMEAADNLWHDRIEGELLQEKLAEHPIDPPITVLTRRYDQLLRNIHEQTHEDALAIFLNSLALTCDPHSEYLSKAQLENFNINMRLKLVGIGAVLRSEDGYAKIMELVPGGPAETDGRLKVGDSISAVAQGAAEFEDVVGMKLDKVVEKIRGKKGTTVRLQVIPAKADDPSQRKMIDIVRDEVNLKEQRAKAEIIERDSGKGGPERIGWITLPSFYAEMDRSGAKDATSTTKDVRRLLSRLTKENISGLVIDLRRNGGGSLEEAINLTGLFIKRGPVVQVKDANGNIPVLKDKDASVAYSGPMVVVTNRLSASASEIFAAAMQDYGRAVVVGDTSTFGKGTVQTMLDIGNFIPFLGSKGTEAGALKLTIQKFYRIAGGSTQLRGVVSDIKLPSPYDHPEIGESAFKNPMPYDEVNAANYETTHTPLFAKELKARSAARVASNAEFRYVREDLDRFQKKLDANTVSLNEKARRAELAEEKAKNDKRTAERAKRKAAEPVVYAITLDNVDQPQLQLAANVEKPKPPVENEDSEDTADENDEKIDAVRAETLNIIADLVQLNRQPKTASTK